MPSGPAARVGDLVAHPTAPTLSPGPGSTNVLIGYKPAWRGIGLMAVAGIAAQATASATTMSTALATGNAPGVAAAAAQFAMMLANLPSCDMHCCGLTTPNPHVGGVVVTGSPTVKINNMPACRLGDMILEAGPPNSITTGCFSVIIGDVGFGGPGSTNGNCMSAAKASGAPTIEPASGLG